MKKPSIPSVAFLPQDVARVVLPIKETVEMLTGARGGELSALSDSATTEEIITAINSIISRLNASGS